MLIHTMLAALCGLSNTGSGDSLSCSVLPDAKAELPCTMHSRISDTMALGPQVVAELYKVADLIEDAVKNISVGANAHSITKQRLKSLSTAVGILSHAVEQLGKLKRQRQCPVLASIIFNNRGLAYYLRTTYVLIKSAFRYRTFTKNGLCPRRELRKRA